MRLALDTNVLVHAEGVGDVSRVERAEVSSNRLPADRTLNAAQTLGELYRVLVGTTGRAPATARSALLDGADSFQIADSSSIALQAALDLGVVYQVRASDALVPAVAAENRCPLVLSEDLQDGFTWRSATVVQPFVGRPHPLLEGLTASG